MSIDWITGSHCLDKIRIQVLSTKSLESVMYDASEKGSTSAVLFLLSFIETAKGNVLKRAFTFTFTFRSEPHNFQPCFLVFLPLLVLNVVVAPCLNAV